MSGDVLALLVLLLAAVVLCATEWIAAELTAALLLLSLWVAGLLPQEEMFAGFGSDVVLFLGSLFVVSAALVRTGALERLEAMLGRRAERQPRAALTLLVLATAAVSAVLSNTATVAAMLPVVAGLARRLRLSPSKLYMPVAYASILGGTLTLIGTSTNIVVAGALPRYGQPTWGFLELAPAALPAVAAGLLYLLTVGQKLLPDRGGELSELYRLREYVTEVMVPPASPWTGQTLRELRAGADLEISVLGRVGPDGVAAMPPDRPLQPGDRLLVKASQQALLRIKGRRELELVADLKSDVPAGRALPVHEVVLPHASRLSGRTLRELSFGTRYNVMVLALFRRGEPMLDRVASVSLRDGDVLLLQGDLAPLAELLRGGHLILLEEAPVPAGGARMWVAAAAFVGMIVVGGAGLAPFSVAAVVAAIVLLLARCLTVRQAYESIDWGVLVLVACLLGLATAMETSGAGEYFASLLAGAAGDLGPLAVLAGFYLLTVVLTQPMSNQAAALVVLPLAMLTATRLGLDARPFAATVTLAASCSFIAPLEPAAMLVYGPGRYRFRDYFRVGLPLTLLVFAINIFMVPRVWPLRASNGAAAVTTEAPAEAAPAAVPAPSPAPSTPD